MQNNKTVSAHVTITFKRFVWEEGLDWARGYLAGDDEQRPIVNIQIDHSGQVRVEWSKSLPFRFEHFPQLMREPSEMDTRGRDGVSLETLKTSLEAKLKDYVFKTYFEIAE